MNEFKQIHQQPNKEAAIKILHAFYDKWNRAYNHVIRNLKEIEPDLLVFYSYPKQIRASIYSTNMIESFNNVIKRKAKPKAEFPTEQSLDTFIGIQAKLQRTLFQSNPQRLWSGSGYLRILLWLNKRLKNQSTRKIYLHKKFDSF